MRDLMAAIWGLDQLVWAYGLLTAACGFMTAILFVAAWRNHFALHILRPVIWALTFMCGTLWYYFALRLYAVYLRTGGDTAGYMAVAASGPWYWSTYAITASMIALAFTLIVAYPGSRRAFK